MFGKAPKCFSHLIMVRQSHFIAFIQERNSKTQGKIYSAPRSKQKANSAVRCWEQIHVTPTIRPWSFTSKSILPVFRMKVKVKSCPTLCDPWTVAHQAPPSMGFSRQEYWSGLPFPSPVFRALDYFLQVDSPS